MQSIPFKIPLIVDVTGKVKVEVVVDEFLRGGAVGVEIAAVGELEALAGQTAGDTGFLGAKASPTRRIPFIFSNPTVFYRLTTPRPASLPACR